MEETPLSWTVLGFGLSSFNAVKIEETPITEEEFFESGESVDQSEVSAPGRFFLPAIRLHVGKRFGGQLDAMFGVVDQSANVFSSTVGPRFNVVHEDRFQLGTFAGLGVRSISQSLQSDVQIITRGGVGTDILLTDGLLVYTQTSFAPETDEEESVGYAILPNQFSFGIGGRF